jgi:hypothetical protein
MNPEAHKIVEELRIFSVTAKSTSLQDTANAIAFLAFRTASLQILLAEEQEKAAVKLEQQTFVLIRFTKILVGLTWALIFIGVVQLVMMFCKP